MWFDTSTTEKKPYYQTQFVNEWWDNGSLPIWITAQSQGLKAGSLHFPGTASSYQGQVAMVREVEPPLYNYKNETAWRENADRVMGWFAERELDFVSLYFGEPDGTGHRYGPDSPQLRRMVEQVDRTVGYIRRAAERRGLTDRLNLIVTSDHGMSAVYRGGQVAEEITLSKIPGFSFKDLSFHLVDFGPSGMLLPKPGRLDKVYAALKGAHPHLHVFKKEEMPERLHFADNDRILPIVLWADPGYVINGYFPVQFHKGEHGFDNQDMDMKPFFRAVGPAFRRNLQVAPFETVNIYALMCHLLGVEPEPNDGHLNATRHMLVGGATSQGGGEGSLQSVFSGVAAAAGVLLVFLATTLKTLQKRRSRERSGSSERLPGKETTEQTSF
ncbi:ectonucleotide pyrophosphatase/phosphodiesterase family member 7-like [Clinocottus analis]|uniref:ectonucleotide pyrophosphatase/phosphodiesterase family member 7-like n=1 Tax=Clinocottus analis TaxID=304258 RepID=UPI0035BFB189